MMSNPVQGTKRSDLGRFFYGGMDEKRGSYRPPFKTDKMLPFVVK